MPDRAQAIEKRLGNRNDVAAQLIEQIGALVGPGYRITIERERPWASITFSGTRHSIAMGRASEGSGQDMTVSLLAFAEKLADHMFDLPGHFVADLLVSDLDAQGETMALEILTIIDPVVRPATGS